MFAVLSEFLIFFGAYEGFFDDFFLALHFPELDFLLSLSQFDEGIAGGLVDVGEADALVGVASGPANPVDVGDGADFFLVFPGFREVDDQGNCPDIDAPADGFGTQEDLDLAVAQACHAGGFGALAVGGVEVLALTSPAVPVHVVDVYVVLAQLVCAGVVDHKQLLLSEEPLVEVLQLSDFVEEDDDIYFLLVVGNET
jgi:hypothetical protein